jgi:hypothetical protein
VIDLDVNGKPPLYDLVVRNVLRCVAAVALVATPGAALAGCGSDEHAAQSTVASTAASATTQADLITVAPPDPNVDPDVQDAVNNSVGDLVERLGIGADEVTVISGQATTWPDASFGCPQPGVQYVQADVDGAIVVLEAGGRQYEYHSGGTGLPELCEQPPTAATASSTG